MSGFVWYFMFYLSLSSLVFGEDNSNILCTSDFCQKYEDKNKCPDIPLACKIQNSTDNGQFIMSPEPCNCCTFCLKNLKLGDDCANGEPGSPNPKAICADSLECINGKCKTMNNTNCMKQQNNWDELQKEGKLGNTVMRPKCDGAGKFQPFICIHGEICFCVDEEGSRLFGKISYDQNSLNFAECRCSRNIGKMGNILGKHDYTLKQFRCQSNGNFDTLQCFNSTCMCVDEKDGYPLNSITKVVGIDNISTLPCYDKKEHVEGYYRTCQKELKNKLDEIYSYQQKGYTLFENSLPNCQLDGRYAAVQENSSIKYCAHPNGTVIEKFSVSKKLFSASSMNCHCARSRSIILNGEKPICCSNGNYKSIQCRRGLCRCVDTNGIQTQKEVPREEIKKLKCYNTPCT